MSDPYRDSSHRDEAHAPRDRGIVGDVIAQFADPYAFYRELVQNAIDAGTPDVTVELSYDDSAQRMRTAVRDRGEGMTRDIIENQLLVLFRSTKEKDRTKIGKFGIGFSSVLAPSPEVVVISTVRDGQRLTAHLYRDLSYELFDSGRATQAGTTIELEIAMKPELVGAFYVASEAALRRWCRHATVPIELVVDREGKRTSSRIDRPLAIEDALVQVTRTVDDGQLTIAVGITPQATPYLGFFNHGLTLAETTDDVLGNVAVKVQDVRLGHTLSRDAVRRDEHYERALDAARDLVRVRLPTVIAERLHELAEQDSEAAYRELVDAVLRARVTPAMWHFPLLAPRGGTRAIAANALGHDVWGAARTTAVTAALAEAGIPVLRVTDRDVLAAAVKVACGAALGDPDLELTAVAPVEPTDADTALLRLLDELFAEVHRSPAAIVLVKLDGARGDLLSVALPDASSRMIDREDAGKNPFAFFGRRTLALSVSHPQVKAARASDDPVLAAAHLARAVLLQHRLLDEIRSRTLLYCALARLGLAR